MNSSLIDSTIFKNAYSTEKMRKCFNDSSRIQSWLDVEAALARAQAKLGIIPIEAAQEINRKAHWKNLDFEKRNYFVLKISINRKINEVLKNCKLQKRVMTTNEAAGLIKKGMTKVTNGFLFIRIT
ncbi:MAG: hypothetical protein KAW42_07330 [Candidatus Atribacteria bacterium]|nr:hypothetical protein [Candidatus Atribacteria bacterium]